MPSNVLPIGSIVTKFNNTFILTDPQYTRGLELWRQVLVTPDTEDVYGISALLPIVAENITFPDKINVSFDINSLKAISVVDTVSLKNKAFAILQNGIGTSPTVKDIKSVVAIAPVATVQQEGLNVLYFNIESLPAHTLSRQEDEALRKSKVAVKAYNVRSSLDVTSDLPMVDEVNGDVATFSFDITDLNYV